MVQKIQFQFLKTHYIKYNFILQHAPVYYQNKLKLNKMLTKILF